MNQPLKFDSFLKQRSHLSSRLFHLKNSELFRSSGLKIWLSWFFACLRFCMIWSIFCSSDPTYSISFLFCIKYFVLKTNFKTVPLSFNSTLETTFTRLISGSFYDNSRSWFFKFGTSNPGYRRNLGTSNHISDLLVPFSDRPLEATSAVLSFELTCCHWLILDASRIMLTLFATNVLWQLWYSTPHCTPFLMCHRKYVIHTWPFDLFLVQSILEYLFVPDTVPDNHVSQRCNSGRGSSHPKPFPHWRITFAGSMKGEANPIGSNTELVIDKAPLLSKASFAQSFGNSLYSPINSKSLFYR